MVDLAEQAEHAVDGSIDGAVSAHNSRSGEKVYAYMHLPHARVKLGQVKELQTLLRDTNIADHMPLNEKLESFSVLLGLFMQEAEKSQHGRPFSGIT